MLHATGANIHEYVWSTGETSSTIIVSPLTNTTYYVTVTDNLHCNTATDAVVLSVSPIPTVNAGSDVAICYGTSTNLYADGLNATGYSWSNGQNTQTTSVAPNTTTVYVVTASNSCGIATDEVIVMINDTLHFSYSVINEACDKSNGMIIAIPNNIYSWSNGATTATVSNLSTGNYIVTITHNNCSATESVFVGNIPGPQADFTVNAHKMTLGDGPFVFTDASQNAVAWFWDFGDGASSSAQNPKHAYNLDGTYKVSLTVVDDNNCSDTKVDEVVVSIYDGFATPNAFTPNGDGLNDAWAPIKLGEDNVIKFELYVYDRWGKLLYETDNVNNSWDGTDGKGKIYSEGVYTYLFNYEISTYDNYKQTGTKIGQVTLLN
jgi:gliding motility-associated-like protein